MKHCVIPSEVSCGTSIGYLVAHQSSKSWTPDKDRMRAVCLKRLSEAHMPSLYASDKEIVDHCERITKGLFNGDLLVTFSN